MSWRLGGAAAAMALLAPSIALGQVTQCQSALIVSKDLRKLNIADKLSILTVVTRSDFDQAKSSFRDRGTAFIGDIPITNDLSWEQFNDKRSKFTSDYRYDLDYKASSYYSSEYLTDTSAGAYDACLRAQHPVGLMMWVEPASARSNSGSVAVNIEFNTPTAKDHHSISVAFDHATPQWTEAQKRHLANFAGPLHEIIFVKRGSFDIDAAMVATVTNALSGQAATLTIVRRPRVQKREVSVRPVERIRIVSANDAHAQSPGVFCFPADTAEDRAAFSDAVIATASAYAEPTDGRGDQAANAPSMSATQACTSYNVGADGSGTGHAARIHLRVELKYETWRDEPVAW